jgi:two-component system, OmpR family, KDP operon response regulator KdpE
MGRLTLDAGARNAALGEKLLCLTPKELEALHALAGANSRAVSPNELTEKVWGANVPNGAQYLRVFIGRMRAKIDEDPYSPKLLMTERGRPPFAPIE